MKNFLIFLFLSLLYATISFADFSPDGSKMVFSSNMSGRLHIYISDSNGQNTKRISREAGSYFNPVWSPRWNMIAFEKYVSGRNFIGVMELDGANERMIVEGYLVENPVWTKDGERILYNKTDKSGKVDLFIIDITGNNETRIILSP